MTEDIFDESDQAAMLPNGIFELLGWDGKSIFENAKIGMLIPNGDNSNPPKITWTYIDSKTKK